jgi:hypothetical protein
VLSHWRVSSEKEGRKKIWTAGIAKTAIWSTPFISEVISTCVSRLPDAGNPRN